MALASKVSALRTDLVALSGQITYRMLADQLKAAIAVAQANGLAAISVTLPTGTTLSYPSVPYAMEALEKMEIAAAGEAGVVFSVGVNLP